MLDNEKSIIIKNVEENLKRLRDFLQRKKCFSDELLNDTSVWSVVRDDEKTQRKGPAWFLFKYSFPSPLSATNPEIVIESLRVAIWAYCAGLTYLRSPDDDIYFAFGELFAKWSDEQKAIAREKSLNGSNSGKKRDSKINNVQLKEKLNAGMAVKKIAADFDVAPQSIYKHHVYLEFKSSNTKN